MLMNGKQVIYRINGKIYHCAMDITMDYIGGKWKSVILWYIKNKTLRFGELKQLIPDITEKTLALQLKSMEKKGLVQRHVFGTKPPLKVEYSLTPFGKTLIPALNAIAAWGRSVGKEHGGLTET